MDNLSYLLIKVSRYLKNALDKKLDAYGVTASQFSVLNQIADKNGSITSAEVASNLNSDRPTISGIIHRLEEKKLLKKIINPDDKRSAYLKLNNDALELVAKLRMVSEQLNDEIFSNFDEGELAGLKESLLKIIEKAEKL